MGVRVSIWTDGGGQNPGTGGWCAILVAPGKVKLLGGYEYNSTNNRVETLAVIHGLEALIRPCHVLICTDSLAYVINGLKRLAMGSMLNTNKDLWERMKPAFERQLSVKWQHFDGHAKVLLNEVADHFAGLAAAKTIEIDRLFKNEQQLVMHAIEQGMSRRKIK